MIVMEQIERLTKAYADARDRLVERVQNMTAEMESVKKDYLPSIKAAVRTCIDRLAELRTGIEKNRDAFRSPKSATFHGIKVGLQKQTGRVQFEDEAQVVKLIRKHMPDRFDELVVTTEKPCKEALERLTVAELAKIGCQVSDTGDKIIVRSVEKDIDKLVSALVREHSEEPLEAAA